MNAPNLAVRLHLRRLPNGSWRGACPACGYGGTFSLREREGKTLWSCASCQDRAALTAAVRDVAGGSWAPPPLPVFMPAGLSPARRTALAVAIWGEAIVIPGTPAEAYLRARGVWEALTAYPPPEHGSQLRFHPRAKHPEADGVFPALLALVRRVEDGEAVAIHRTYLRPDGSGKAAVEPAKATLGPVARGAIMLHAPATAAPLVVAEGIETALAASHLLGGPAWAAVSAGNLERLPLPASACAVILAADADAPGQRAVWTAAKRLEGEGRHVRVAVPDMPGGDFNDLLRRSASMAEVSRG
jgi:phage/plasmid primase-like uncharacterized protein